MQKFTLLRKNVITGIVALMALCTGLYSTAQVVRPYGAIYSNTLKGGHTMFGNTITAVYSSGSGSTGTVNTAVMNDFGSYSNGTTSNSGNDNSNIQQVDVDGVATNTAIIATGASWNYHTANNEPAGWPNVSLSGGPGASPLGYGSTSTVATTLTDRRTSYFTRTVNFNPASFSGFTLNLTVDDGAVVFVNGVEVARFNMPGGDPGYTTNASDCVGEEFSTYNLSAGAPFINGNNTIQVEVHTCEENESGTDDLYFNLELTGIVTNTVNSSSANLVLPGGTNTIKYARLYWGGRINSGMGGAANVNLRRVKIRKGTSGAYTSLTTAATLVDKVLVTGSGTDSAYQSFIDITSIISSGGAGTYTVADVTSATGSTGSGGNFAGWTIVVVYENLALPYSSVRVYDGYIQVYNGGSPVNQSVVLTGLNVPSSPLVASDAYMSTFSWEGDANLAASGSNPNGDYLKVNGIAVSNAVNPVVNMWNGTISRNGAHVTTKNPHFLNQMGVDLDEIEVGVGYGILGNATSVAIEFGTEADQYFPSLFAFTMKTKDPSITLDKTVSDATAPFGVLQTNELLTYTLSGSNLGPGLAFKTTVVDTIPTNVTYEPNTLVVNYSPGFPNNMSQTDAADADFAFKATNGSKHYVKYYLGTGATAVMGGVLLNGETYSVSFKVRTLTTASQLSTVSNTARVTAESAGGDLFTDDGSVLIGPPGGTTAVKMLSFSVKKEGANAMLRWSTSSEVKNDRFEIERSVDGINFIGVGSVPGNGTVNNTKYYQFPDPLANITAKVLYYRLRIVDIDGKNTFSTIVILRMDGTVLTNYTVYPNPFTNDIKLQIRSAKEEVVTIRFINSIGQQVIARAVTLQPGDNIVVLKDLEALRSGMNIMEVITSEGTISEKIIKR